MTPNIQYQSCPALDEATQPSVTYIQGQYVPVTSNPDTGKVMVADGSFLAVNNNGTYGENTTGTIFTPDYENRVLVMTSSFQYKFKIPYKGL